MGNVEGGLKSPTVAVIPMSKFCKHFKGSRAKVNRILKMKYYYYQAAFVAQCGKTTILHTLTI